MGLYNKRKVFPQNIVQNWSLNNDFPKVRSSV